MNTTHELRDGGVFEVRETRAMPRIMHVHSPKSRMSRLFLEIQENDGYSPGVTRISVELFMVEPVIWIYMFVHECLNSRKPLFAAGAVFEVHVQYSPDYALIVSNPLITHPCAPPVRPILVEAGRGSGLN